MEYAPDPQLFPPFRPPASRWERTGLSPERERWFNTATALLVALFAIGWGFAIAESIDQEGPPRLARRITANPLARTAPPPAAFLLNAVMGSFAPYRGESGALRVAIREPGEAVPALGDTIPVGVDVAYASTEEVGADSAAVEPATPGIWNVVLRMRDAARQVPDFSVITLVPRSEKRDGRIGGYRIGSWPFEEGGAPKPVYRPPSGLIRVTPENQNLRVSEHFLLREFLTKGQEDVWPKYVALSARLLDKLELTLQELEEMGHPVERVFVVSGFRTPNYNEAGGDPSGRGALSRHMYGDAADIAIDNDGNGRMDDLNGDGRVTVADARVIAEAAERVEREHPNLIGGIGVYAPTGAHSGMVHIDTRGFRARW